MLFIIESEDYRHGQETEGQTEAEAAERQRVRHALRAMCSPRVGKLVTESAATAAAGYLREREKKREEAARNLSRMMRADLGVEVAPERLAEWINERWSRVSVAAHAIKGH